MENMKESPQDSLREITAEAFKEFFLSPGAAYDEPKDNVIVVLNRGFHAVITRISLRETLMWRRSSDLQ